MQPSLQDNTFLVCRHAASTSMLKFSPVKRIKTWDEVVAARKQQALSHNTGLQSSKSDAAEVLQKVQAKDEIIDTGPEIPEEGELPDE